MAFIFCVFRLPAQKTQTFKDIRMLTRFYPQITHCSMLKDLLQLGGLLYPTIMLDLENLKPWTLLSFCVQPQWMKIKRKRRRLVPQHLVNKENRRSECLQQTFTPKGHPYPQMVWLKLHLSPTLISMKSPRRKASQKRRFGGIWNNLRGNRFRR